MARRATFLESKWMQVKAIEYYAKFKEFPAVMHVVPAFLVVGGEADKSYSVAETSENEADTNGYISVKLNIYQKNPPRARRARSHKEAKNNGAVRRAVLQNHLEAIQ